MPVTMYEPTSLQEAAQFLQDGANRAAQQNDALAYGAMTSALAIIAPALRFMQEQKHAEETEHAYHARVEEIREAAAELNLGLFCMCPDCEAVRAGREDPICECDDCLRMRGVDVEEEDDPEA